MLVMLLLVVSATALGETHTAMPERFHPTFHNRHAPLARVKSGDTIVTRTIDAGGADEKGTRRADGPNPLTGPFYVEGAAPGDTLVVRFDRIRMNRNWGWSNIRLGLFSLAPESVEGLFPRRYKEGLVRPDRADLIPWDLDLDKNMVRVREPQSQRIRLEFPARPMLGCVGVAAPGDFGPTSAISGPYGGNMDYNEVVEGATLHLPVYHAGALLFVGDGHALQADGEPTGTGVETSMDVTMTVSLKKNTPIPGPRLINDEYIIAIASQPEFVSSLDRTLRVATSDMADWLIREYKIEPWAAHQLIGYQGKYDVITVGGSMGLRIPRKALPKPE